MSVIYGLLSEEDVLKMPDSLLSEIASLAQNDILVQIQEYMDDEEADSAVADRLEKFFGQYIDKFNFLNSEETKKAVERIQSLTYDMINPSKEIAYLEVLRDSIASLIYHEHAEMYIQPKDGARTAELIEKLNECGFRQVAESISLNRECFSDKRSATAKGTCMKYILKDYLKYDLMVKAANFLIKNKKKGVKPASWRYL